MDRLLKVVACVPAVCMVCLKEYFPPGTNPVIVKLTDADQ